MAVTIAGESYDSYADVAAADLWMRPTQFATAWDRIDDDDTKSAHLVEASRRIDRLPFVPAFESQTQRIADPAFANAACEWAGMMAAAYRNPRAIRRADAGAVGIEFDDDDDAQKPAKSNNAIQGDALGIPDRIYAILRGKVVVPTTMHAVPMGFGDAT